MEKGGGISRQMREEAIADLSSRSGGELWQCEECGAMRVAAGDTNYKEFSRQVVVNITALLPTGRRYHHRLGRRSPHSLPSSKPAGEQRGGEQPGRRSLEGLVECWGIWENFQVTFGLGVEESESFIILTVYLVYIYLSVLDTTLW